ncbi:DUF58 domain-containing protein [Desulforhabdus sp. TSK]|uniref:DUF58 domain-containing protein n=1 Tax=Desulforhabdus sp. TSK TaxID=2925014 RepID=UPI001FC7ED88|nr:DUF58 domain-containing protein [Desulforhabdus sp. TSK]GKT06941.1 hypothetical protein DSTSK_02460 [Desulforhabdus sp. TSK]
MIQINKAGFLYILLTLLIGFSAVNTGNNLVYIVTSALLSYMVISGIFGSRNLHAVEASLEFPGEIYAGTNVPVRVRLVNRRKLMPAFLIRIIVNEREILIPFINARSTVQQSLQLGFQRRGRHSVQYLRLSSVFPFNFFTRFRTIPLDLDLVVFPQPVACRLTRQSHSQNPSKGEALSDLAGFEEDLRSIRNYVSGDPVKYISWKSTAKTGLLKTKELSSIEREHCIIDMDRMEKRDLEHAVSCVTYTILKLLRTRTPVGLHLDGETLKPDVSAAHRLRILTKLALYGED